MLQVVLGRLFNGTLRRCLHKTAILKDVHVKMPSLSPTMTTGTVVKWLKQEGDEVAPGDVLCEIQTDKAVVSMEVDDEGTLAKIIVQENIPDIEVGSLIAIMAEPGEDWKAVKIPEGLETAAPKLVPSPPVEETPKPSEVIRSSEVDTGRVSEILGPAVRLLLEKYNLLPEKLHPTGPHGVLLKGDVMNYISKQSLTPADVTEETKLREEATAQIQATVSSVGDFTDIPLTNMRKTIAKRLSESKRTIPHSYATVSVRMNSVIKLRKQLKDGGTNVSVNDFIVKASAFALRSVPEANVQFDGENLKYQSGCDISVAVATEAGLITPIIYSADILGIEEISAKIKELAEKAKENKLQPNEFMGGTFTVSNLGMFGISEFTAIINPPQAAILAVGGSFDTLSTGLTLEPRMKVTLCFDNRAMSESDAQRFLQAFSEGLEDPDLLLLASCPPSLFTLEKDDDDWRRQFQPEL